MTTACNTQGYLSFVLHAHLPFVRHPEYSEFLEEDWLYEAITETYIPLIRLLRRFENEGLDYRLTLSITPTLMHMLDDTLLRARYENHLDKLLRLSAREYQRTAHHGELQALARFYHKSFEDTAHYYENNLRDGFIGAFRELAAGGRLHLMTSAATHGFLPLMQVCPEAVRAQIVTGFQEFRRHFGKDPSGLWLPECGYFPDLAGILRDAGIRYTFLDAHGLLYGKPCPTFGVYAPVWLIPGVAAFGRDPVTAKVVWSAMEGYPGDSAYRDFHRDIGFELSDDDLRGFLGDTTHRKATGIKYHRITDRFRQHKLLYDPLLAEQRVAAHADHFLAERVNQSVRHHQMFHKAPLIVSPYDAELFGHWWFEGIQWLDQLVRKIHSRRFPLEWMLPTEYLEKFPVLQNVECVESSWGEKGFHEYWLSEQNDWIYPHLNEAAHQMVQIAREHPRARGLVQRGLNQAARELLLAQSSDWAFIMRSGTVVPYAVKRQKTHLSRFKTLLSGVKEGKLDPDWLEQIEKRDNIFPAIDYRIYR